MHALNENQRRELIGQFYYQHSSKPKSFTVHHFEEMGVPRRTTYNAIQRVCSGGSLKRKTGSGRVAEKMPKKKVRRLLNMFKNKTGCSQRKAAAKFNISQRYVGKLLRKNNVRKFKRQKAPNPHWSKNVHKRLAWTFCEKQFCVPQIPKKLWWTMRVIFHLIRPIF